MSRRRGRPTRWEQTGDDSAWALWQRAERLHVLFPTLSWTTIARRYLGVHPSTLRRWRHEFTIPGAPLRREFSEIHRTKRFD